MVEFTQSPPLNAQSSKAKSQQPIANYQNKIYDLLNRALRISEAVSMDRKRLWDGAKVSLKTLKVKLNIKKR
ncbi:MAG: hypothetical protein UIQ67_05575 [Bacteroidales bacterium]|nr:hypothetical protein [Bacteroidales bacterium]